MRKIFLAVLMLLWCSTASAANTASTGNWSDGTKWTDGSKPGADDDVVIPTGVTMTIDENAVCRSITLQGTATLTHGAYSLSIGDATAGAGNVALEFSATATYTISAYNTSVINFISSSSTTQTVNFAGKNTGNVTFGSSSVGGSYQLTGTWGTSGVNSNQSTVLTRGSLNTNGQTIHWGRFNSVGTYTRSSSWNGSSVYLYYPSGAFVSFTIGRYSNTFTQGTGVFYIVGAGNESYPCYLSGDNLTFTNIVFTGTYGKLKGDGLTVENLTVTPPSSARTSMFQFEGTNTISGTVTFTGPSLTGRLLVASNTLGTQRTITYNGTANPADTISNTDFRDITVGGTYGEWDLSSIAGGSGNCGGNSGITFTTADDWYWNGSGTRNLSDYTYWYTETNGGGTQMASTRTVLPQDTLYFDADSIDGATTIDQDLPRIPGIDFTGVDAVAFHMDNIAQTIYGSLTFTGNVTETVSTTYALTFEGRGQYTYTPINSAKNQTTDINALGGGSNGVQLLGDLNIGTQTLTLNYGILDADDQNVTAAKFNSDNSNARTLLMGSGTWTINSTTAGNSWDMGAVTNLTNPTTMGETSTIIWGGATNNAMVFEGGGLTYNNLSVVATGTSHSITGSNTFNTLTINAPKTVKFTANTTTTVSSFVAEGTVANPIVLDNTTATGSLAATLSDSSGTNTVKYCTIGTTYNVNATGGATWNALTTDGNTVTNGTGWTQTATVVETGRRRSWMFN